MWSAYWTGAAPEDLAFEHPDHSGGCGGHRGAAGAGVHEGDLPKAVAAGLPVDAHVDALPPLQHLKLPTLHHVQLAGSQAYVTVELRQQHVILACPPRSSRPAAGVHARLRAWQFCALVVPRIAETWIDWLGFSIAARTPDDIRTYSPRVTVSLHRQPRVQCFGRSCRVQSHRAFFSCKVRVPQCTEHIGLN